MALREKFRLSNLFVEIISFIHTVFIDYKDQTIAIHQGNRFNLRQWIHADGVLDRDGLSLAKWCDSFIPDAFDESKTFRFLWKVSIVCESIVDPPFRR